MPDQSREAKLSRAFVALADTLVTDYDLVELMQTLVETCADVLDVTAAGLLLKDASDDLHVLASTTEDARFVEVVQLGVESGPCWDCAATGRAVSVPDIEATGDRWPEFRDAALQRGLRAVHATPLRLRETVIGTVNLFNMRTGALNASDAAAAQALSDVATIGILSERATRQHELVGAQLQRALDSRVVIEQAKGVLAQSLGLSVDDAFGVLRSFARARNRGLRDVAAALVERRLDASAILEGAPSVSAPRRTDPRE